MKIRHFHDAGWNAGLLKRLDEFGAAGIEVSCETNLPDEARVDALQAIGQASAIQHAPFNCWIVLGHTAIQPSSRVVHYKKLWKSLDIEAASAADRDAIEWAIEADGGVRYFGVMRHTFDPTRLVPLLAREQISWLVVTEKTLAAVDVMREIEGGWTPEEVFPQPLLKLIEKENVLVLRSFGATERQEAGAIALGSRQRISELAEQMRLSASEALLNRQKDRQLSGESGSDSN